MQMYPLSAIASPPYVSRMLSIKPTANLELFANVIFQGCNGEHLGNPSYGCEGVDNELALCDIIPCNRLAILYQLLLGAQLANEADVEVEQQLCKIEGTCSTAAALLFPVYHFSARPLLALSAQPELFLYLMR